MADERDLGSRVLWRVGSSPTFRITNKVEENLIYEIFLIFLPLSALIYDIMSESEVGV